MLSTNPLSSSGQRLAPSAMPRAVFEKDVNDTYNTICDRAQKAKEEDAKAGTRETIQLMCEEPGTQIQFNVPDGPPPENITLEGEGIEDLDPVQVRAALMRRWQIFQAFTPAMQRALKNQSLEEVNVELEKMEVVDGEEVVKLLDASGILSFASTDIRDETKGGDGKQSEDSGPAPDPE